MAYPVLAEKQTWFTPTNSSVTTSNITEIEIKDSYTPESSVSVTDSWDASAAKDGSITCYAIGTKLIIAGNGSGKITLSTNSSTVFANFKNATSISNLNLIDSSNVTNIMMGFYGLEKIKTLDVGNWDVSNVEKAIGIFAYNSELVNLDVSKWNTSNMKRTNQMFDSCKALMELNLSMWDTSKMETFYAMFYHCENLVTIGDTSKWDLSSCSEFESAFAGCYKLEHINTATWNLSSCMTMSFMFYSCSSLGEIDVSNWDVSKVTNFDHFAAHANLKRKGIENWKTTSATNMNALFHNCAEEELDLSGWDVSKNQFFCQMFENSPNLKRIKGLENWDTSSGLGFDGMFERCYKLEEVDLSSFNTTKAKNGVKGSTNDHTTATMNNMFLSCNNLKKVKVGPNFSINGDGTNTTAANKAILPTPSTDYITSADGMWYAFNGEPYAPNAIKDKTAETYFASYALCADQDIIVKNGSMIEAAKAIREKNGATDHYTPAQFGAAIRALS